MVRVVLLSTLVALFSISCSQSSVEKTSELSPEDMLEQAHRALLNLEYFKFSLSHSGDGTELFPGVMLSGIEGYLEFPDKSEFIVSAQLASMLLETRVVMTGGSVYMTDFFSGHWQEIPSDSLPINVLYFREALSSILVSLENVELLGSVDSEGEFVTIKGTMRSSVIADFLSFVLPDDDVATAIILKKDDNMLARIILTGKILESDDVDMVRTLTLDGLDMPLPMSEPNITN